MDIKTFEQEAVKTLEKPLKKAGSYWHTLGPGLTTGASDDDPSGVATYSQTGAAYGYGLLWLAAWTFPLMAAVQEMCARIGLVTGRGLAGNIRLHFPRWVLYACTILLFAANSFNIGADLGAMAKATQLLVPQMNFAVLIFLFTAFSLWLQIFTPYARYAKYLKWLALILFSYIFTALTLRLDWGVIAQNAVIPRLDFDRQTVFLVCGILGTTISPYLFFWQTSQEVEEEINRGKTTIKLRQAETTPKEIKTMRIDVWSGMFFSNLVMFFIIVTCAATLNAHGFTDIKTAEQAAAALKPLAGSYASLLFTLGIVGVGLLSIPVLAGSASYAISEAFGWKEGLYRKFKQAHWFYGVIIVSMSLGLALNFVGLDPIKALIYAAVANGLVAPIILILIVKLSGNKTIMGQWANKPWCAAFGWIIIGLMTITGAATIISLFF